MATATGGQPGALLGVSSSFGQFRLTTFVDGHPKHPNTSIASPIPNLRTTAPIEIAEEVSGLQDGRSTLHTLPPRQDPSVKNVTTSPPKSLKVVSPPAPPTDTTAHSHNGFGVLDLAPPVVKEGKLGPHRDGRVRNPVPRKLKGKTDDKNGNFAVMHMDMTGSGYNKLPRSEAAKRTSENTAQAARTAQRDGYVPLKRRRVEAAIDSPKLAAPINPAAASSAQVLPLILQQNEICRTEILNSEETKYEQARLLTLLRSINPLTVVDQICKALAFFGGIPGAPPPKDGRFPESEEANGSGGLFVGWLAEIFPELERQGRRPEISKALVQLHTRRPRGRPRGSKATKVRKDKGIKKGPKYAENGHRMGVSAHPMPRLRAATSEEQGSDPTDDEWIDIGDSSQVLVETARRPNLVEANFTTKKIVSQDTGNHNLLDISGPNDLSMPEARPIIPIQNYNQQPQPPTAHTERRKPGRPRGSRNRPKEIEVSDENHHNTFNSIDAHSSSQPYSDHLFSQPSRQLVGQPAGLQNAPKASDTPGNPSSRKESASGNRTQASSSAAKPHGAKNAIELDQNSKVPAQLSDLSPEEQAILEAFRSARAAQSPNPPTPAKRKRSQHKISVASTNEPAAIGPVGKITGNPQPLVNINPTPSQSYGNLVDASSSAIFPPSATESVSPLLPAAHENSIPIVLQPSNQTEISSTVPPPKKQRKANVPSAKKKTTLEAAKSASMSTITPVTKPTSTPSSTFLSSKNVSEPLIPASRPQAQGLEAHYEHFAQLQQQKQQEQHRPRIDQNSLARPSPLQSSTNFYQQTQHTPSPFGQQFAAHQSSHSYHTAHASQSDSYRAVNNQPQHTSFSPRQQASSFSHFSDSNFIDLPALESASNGATNVNTYGTGQGLARSASQGNYSTASVMGTGFESGISDSDLRERLMRGIGRR